MTTRTEVERVPPENVHLHDDVDVFVYIYAGFLFHIERDDDWRPIGVTAVSGQHHAAYKEKHARNAFASFLADLKGGAK